MYGKWLVIFVLPALAGAQRRKPDVDPPAPCDYVYAQPEQVHLSYAGPNSLWVSWLTFHSTDDSTVEYGVDGRDKEARANVSSFVDGSAQSKPRFIHRALLDNLDSGKPYRVGSRCGWSDLFSFVALAPRPDGSFKYAFYGDMGSKNAESVGKLQNEAQNGDFDMVLHIGDFAYNFEDNNGDTGDEFMRQIEPIAAYVPYMAVVGNHEYAGHSFAHYKNRFITPGSEDNFFDLGRAHFIAFSTEFYYNDTPGGNVSGIIRQWKWIKSDLEKANDNRRNVPWIITMGHRPMYCDTTDLDYCNYADNAMRIGINRNSSGYYQYGLEDLFYTYGVDLELWAHEHVYERMFPVYNRTVFNGTYNPYIDPPAPVFLQRKV